MVLSKVSREIAIWLAFRVLHRSPAAEYLFGSWLFQHNCQRTGLHLADFIRAFLLFCWYYIIHCNVLFIKVTFKDKGWQIVKFRIIQENNFTKCTSVAQWFSLLVFPCFLFYTLFTLSKILCSQSVCSQCVFYFCKNFTKIIMPNRLHGSELFVID
jgi:hypothetical protein